MATVEAHDVFQSTGLERNDLVKMGFIGEFAVMASQPKPDTEGNVDPYFGPSITMASPVGKEQ